MEVVVEEGDFFGDLERARGDGCNKVVGEGFGLWGRWVYDKRTGKLISIFTSTIGKQREHRAYIVNPEFEETALRYRG